MKSNDLMIGDIVHINNKELEYEHDAIVVSIEPSFVGVNYIDSSESDQFALKVIEPITIDGTALIHNGFEESYDKDYDNNRYYLNCDDHRILLLTSSNDGSYLFKTNSRYVHIKYVHELQHLLRLIGESELADNFKLI